MIEKTLILRSIKKKADGDFSTYMSRENETKDIERILNYAAKKANKAQKELAETSK